jgi:speckle-type POZ protein
MAASQSPIVRVPSRCIPEKARATLAFEVVGYSLHKGLGRDNCLCSPAFSVGGYEWCIRYYPDGNESESETSEDYVSVSLELLTKNVKVKASFAIKLVKAVTRRTGVVRSSTLPVPLLFDGSGYWGENFWKRIVELESVYLQDDRLVFDCDIEVIKETLAVQLPPSKNAVFAHPYGRQGLILALD